jgi:hypothetical protein
VGRIPAPPMVALGDRQCLRVVCRRLCYSSFFLVVSVPSALTYVMLLQNNSAPRGLAGNTKQIASRYNRARKIYTGTDTGTGAVAVCRADCILFFLPHIY